MVSVGGMFDGGVVEQVIVRAIFDNEGYKTGVKETIKVNQKLSSEIQKQSTHIKNADGEWEELSHTLKRNTKNADALRKKLENINKHMAKMRAAKFAKMHQRISDMGSSDIVRDSKGQMIEGTRITKMTPALNQFTKRIVSSETQIKKLKNGMEEHLTTFKNYRGGVVKTTKAIKRQQSQFQMWALSFLFAGMQIKRTAEMITRASVGTFMKITQGQTEAGRSIIGLAANFKFLQFQIGEAIGKALKPLMPMLVGIIRWIADFTSKHPKLVAGFIGFIFVAGTALFIIGQLVMFISALGSAEFVAGLHKIAGGFKAMAIWTGKTLIPILALVALFATVAALGLSIGFMWKNITKAFKIRFQQIKLWGENVWGSLMHLFKQAGLSFQGFVLLAKYWMIKFGEGVGNFLLKPINKIIDAVNGMIDKVKGWNELLPEKFQLDWINDLTKFSKVELDFTENLSDVENKMLEVQNKKLDAAEKYADNVFSWEMRRQNLQAQLALNRESAGNNLEKGWSQVIGGLTGGISNASSAIQGAVSNENTDIRQNVNVDNLTIEYNGEQGSLGDTLMSLQDLNRMT